MANQLKSMATAILTLALGASALAAQPASDAGELIGNWNVSCDSGVCQAFFGLKHPTEDWEILRWSLLYDARTDRHSTMIRTPTGVALPPGLRVWTASDEWVEIPFQVCDPQGCEAAALLDDALREKLLGAGDTVTVSFIAYGQSEPTGIEVPIRGLEEAMDRLTTLE